MRGRPGILLCAALVLLAVPGSSGQGLVSLSASQATLAGDAAVAATLAGIVIEDTACSDRPALFLSVAQGTHTLENETAEAWANPTVGTPRNNTQWTVPL